MSVGDWIGLFAAIGGAAAALAAFLGVLYQVRLARGSSSIDNIQKMQDQWESPRLLEQRSRAAASLLDGKTEDKDIVAIVNFFEQLGYLVAEKAVKAETAWECFADWALPYWVATRTFVRSQQKTDKTYWENFDLLNRELVAIEARRRHLSTKTVVPKQDNVDKFLLEERHSSTTQTPATLPGAWRRP